MAEKNEPIWVESLLTPEEYRECHKKYPSTVTKSVAPAYIAANYPGGTWRAGMGRGLSADEIARYNKGLDKLRELIHTKKFQHRPEYGPHNEAKPSNY